MSVAIYKHHGSYNIEKRDPQDVKYIVLHYVGSGKSTEGNALANCKFFASGDKQASAHYFVDDGGVYEYADPAAYLTWHCGDGHGKYGITNRNSIGIEVCINGDKPYTEKEIKYLKELVPLLMTRFNVKADHVVRHFDASRKLCPYYYARRPEEWKKLHSLITAKTKKAAPTKSAKAILTANIKTGQKGLNKIVPAKFKLVVNGVRSVATRKAEIAAVQKGLNADYKCYLDPDGSFGSKTKKVASAHPVKKGAKGLYVKAIQASLYCHGYSPTGIDGKFGKGTDAAVREFQKAKGLEVDGSVGPATIAELLK